MLNTVTYYGDIYDSCLPFFNLGPYFKHLIIKTENEIRMGHIIENRVFHKNLEIITFENHAPYITMNNSDINKAKDIKINVKTLKFKNIYWYSMCDMFEEQEIPTYNNELAFDGNINKPMLSMFKMKESVRNLFINNINITLEGDLNIYVDYLIIFMTRLIKGEYFDNLKNLEMSICFLESENEVKESALSSTIDKIFDCLSENFLYVKNGFENFIFDVTFYDNIHILIFKKQTQ